MIPKMIPIFVEFILSLYKSISYKRVQRRLGDQLKFSTLISSFAFLRKTIDDTGFRAILNYFFIRILSCSCVYIPLF